MATYHLSGLRKVRDLGYKCILYLIHPFSVPGEPSPPLSGHTHGTDSDVRTDVVRRRTIVEVQRDVADTHAMVSEILRTVAASPKEGKDDLNGLVRSTLLCPSMNKRSSVPRPKKRQRSQFSTNSLSHCV